MAEEKTVVIFRKFPEGDIIALFPEIPSDYWGLECQSYMHIGQHGGADCGRVVAATKPAKPSEYKDLKKELERIGYVLDVKERTTPAMQERRVAEVNRQRRLERPEPSPFEHPSQLRLFGRR